MLDVRFTVPTLPGGATQWVVGTQLAHVSNAEPNDGSIRNRSIATIGDRSTNRKWPARQLAAESSGWLASWRSSRLDFECTLMCL